MDEVQKHLLTTDLIIGHESDEQKIPLSHLPLSLSLKVSLHPTVTLLTTSLRFLFFLSVFLIMTFLFCFLTFPHSISLSSFFPFLLLFRAVYASLIVRFFLFSIFSFLSLFHPTFFQSWNHWIRIFIFIHFIFPAQFLTTLLFIALLFIGCSVCIFPLHIHSAFFFTFSFILFVHLL